MRNAATTMGALRDLLAPCIGLRVLFLGLWGTELTDAAVQLALQNHCILNALPLDTAVVRFPAGSAPDLQRLHIDIGGNQVTDAGAVAVLPRTPLRTCHSYTLGMQGLSISTATTVHVGQCLAPWTPTLGVGVQIPRKTCRLCATPPCSWDIVN